MKDILSFNKESAHKQNIRRVLDIDVTSISYEDILFRISKLAEERIPSYVCFANAHMIVEAHLNKETADSVNKASIVTSDGMSVVLALKYLHQIKQARASGMDMIYDVMKRAEKDNHSIFLFGNENETMHKFIQRAKVDYPTLNIEGFIAPPFTEFTIEENEIFINTINESNSNIVFVSLGCPKQEKWMSDNSNKIHSVLLGFGAALPMYALEMKRAPLFMQQHCLEWLFRLWQEPNRLWKRYLVTNTLFVYYFIKQLLKRN